MTTSAQAGRGSRSSSPERDGRSPASGSDTRTGGRWTGSGDIASFDALRRAVVTLRATGSDGGEDVKVWAHRVTPEGESEALAATAVFRSERPLDPVDLSLSRGEAVFPLSGSEAGIEIVLREPERGGV